MYSRSLLYLTDNDENVDNVGKEKLGEEVDQRKEKMMQKRKIIQNINQGTIKLQRQQRER